MMSNLTSFSDLLTDDDRILIASLIGRQPLELELELIAMVRQAELLARSYWNTIYYLDIVAQRIDNTDNLIRLNEECSLLVNGGIKFLSTKGRIIRDSDQAHRKQAIRGVPLLAMITGLKICPESQPNRKSFSNFIKRALSRGIYNGAVSTGCQTVLTSQVKSINIQPTINVSIFNDNQGQSPINMNAGSLIFCIHVGYSWTEKKSDQTVLSLIQRIDKRPWFFQAVIISEKGVGSALIELVEEQSNGVKVAIEGSIVIEALGANRAEDILVVIQPGFESELQAVCDELNLAYKTIGTIQNEPNLTIFDGNNSICNIPITAFDFLHKSVSSSLPVFNQRHVTPVEMDSIRKLKNYNNVFKKLLATILSENQPCILTSTKRRDLGISFEHGLIAENGEGCGTIAMTAADNDHFCQLDPYLGGRLSVANAIRQLVCRGATPIVVTLQNVFPDAEDSEITWNGNAILQGQEEVLRYLKLPIGERQIITYDGKCVQYVGAIGLIPSGVRPITRGFQAVGDFISLLGSHRGELGGSDYLRIIRGIYQGIPPTVDLRMEKRLHEVILQGIHGGLIKSASNVSGGGLVTAIAFGLICGRPGLGARIHFSRKLRNDELLFGETQGPVIITLGEEDIMEFERICMNIGVPSTTIGRVTDEDRLTFNDLISIPAKVLKNLEVDNEGLCSKTN